MGTCIICGKDVDGHVCASHEEDVAFVFEGQRPDQLTPGRYYRGRVDGFAEFGVFIDIGDHVTGLLHTSELDRRLESLDWEPGETVYVQVKNVRDNGNVDLGWSIRRTESEFRGALIDTPDGDRLPDGETTVADDPSSGSATTVAGGGSTTSGSGSDGGSVATQTTGGGGTTSSPTTENPTETTATSDDAEVVTTQFERTAIEALTDSVGDPVRIEGEVIDVRQTSGPTIFELRDETGSVECAAFESAGVRAYPDVETGDIVRLDGVAEERRGAVQVETESLTTLDGEDQRTVAERLESAIEERARPDDAIEPVAELPAIAELDDAFRAAATTIRRAVFETRPVVIRHQASTDGYVAGAALERALIPLVTAEHDTHDAEYHFVDRRPVDGRVYEMGDAMRDTTRMLEARDRHEEALPLFVYIGTGGTEESRDGFDLLDTYGAERIVIDGGHPDRSMADAVRTLVSAEEGSEDVELTSTALAVEVAQLVNPDVAADLSHLPAVSYWRDVPNPYQSLAETAGYDEEATTTIREAIALEAFYQAYEDKRELIADLLFEEPGLAGPASEQFRTRIDREVRTAEPHLEQWSVAGGSVAVLDIDAFTHHFDFPPAEVLLGELGDRAGEFDAIIGVDEDELIVWTAGDLDRRAVADEVAEEVPDGGVSVRGGRDGTVTFLSGRREAVIGAAVQAVATRLS